MTATLSHQLVTRRLLQMNIEALSGAATVALTTTIVFLLVAKFWSAFSRAVGSAPNFGDSIMHEAAERFREEFERLSASQSIYLSAALVFAMLFAAAYVLEAQQLFLGYPDWQLYLQLGFLILTLFFALYEISKTVMERREVRFLRDANVAIGHQLHRISSGNTRVYHDVATDAGIVDHVVVGPSGVYAINVVAYKARKAGHARLDGNTLFFPGSDAGLSVANIAEKSARLEKEFRQLLDHKVRVRSVIATPGWDIGEQSSELHLLVNERNIAMLRGWRDNSDHLMNDDVESLQNELTAKCRRVSAPATD